MSKINIFKDIEVIAEDVYKEIVKGDAAVAKYSVPGLAALAVLASGVEKALTDVSTTAANPTSIVVTLPTDIADFKAVWGDAKGVLTAIGITV